MCAHVREKLRAGRAPRTHLALASSRQIWSLMLSPCSLASSSACSGSCCCHLNDLMVSLQPVCAIAGIRLQSVAPRISFLGAECREQIVWRTFARCLMPSARLPLSLRAWPNR